MQLHKSPVFLWSLPKYIWLPISVIALFSCTYSEKEKEQVRGLKRRQLATSAQPLSVPVDSIVVRKNLREMAVYKRNILIKVYSISLGTGLGKKHFEGDNKTPEGLYHINGRNASSQYHKNLGVSYPDASDKEYAARAGKSPGGDIKIHGLPNRPQYPAAAYLDTDWTLGCVAVSNEDIDELYRMVVNNCPVLFLP